MRKHFLPGRRIYLNCKFIVLTIHKKKGKIDNSCDSNVLFIYVVFLIYIFNFSPPVLKYIAYVCLHVYKKKKVGENGELQLSNGDCTTERKCGFCIWHAKTMSSSRGTKLILPYERPNGSGLTSPLTRNLKNIAFHCPFTNAYER